jgi:hypothetical protein
VIRRFVGMGAAAVLLCAAPIARAEASAESQADALFTEGKHLRDAGQLSEACSKFAQAQRLSPGVGIALYLGDCYERIGRRASAWQEFRSAEKLAKDHDDKRAETARGRAEALEPKLNRLRVDVPASAASAGADLRVDGASIPHEAWNVPLAIDPGDHVVSFAMPGQAPRAVSAYVDPTAPIAVVQVAEATQAAPAPAPAPAAAAQPQPAPVAPPVAAPSAASSRRWLEYGLVGASFLSIGVGATLLATNGQSSDSGPTNGAIVAFSTGGAALVAAFVVFFASPQKKDAPKESAFVVAPAPLPGGGGAFLHASF